MVSQYNPDCPVTHSVDQTGLELRNWPASASQVWGLKACATVYKVSSRTASQGYTEKPCLKKTKKKKQTKKKEQRNSSHMSCLIL